MARVGGVAVGLTLAPLIAETGGQLGFGHTGDGGSSCTLKDFYVMG